MAKPIRANVEGKAAELIRGFQDHYKKEKGIKLPIESLVEKAAELGFPKLYEFFNVAEPEPKKSR